MKYEEAINAQYGQSDLGNKLLSALQKEGFDSAEGIKKALARIEELHLGGSVATLELAQKVGIYENSRVLDIGCGIGGPARNLASTFGCHVTGIDLSKDYCQAAEIINHYLGLSDFIKIIQGNALNMHFNRGEFDVIFIQHVLMNIENKSQLLSQIYKILSLKGRLALNTICTGSIRPILFPVIFASDPSISFLIAENELHQLIINSGFEELSWNNVTNDIIEGIQRARSRPRTNQPRSSIADLIFSNVSEKWRNGVRNLKEDRWVVIRGAFQRS